MKRLLLLGGGHAHVHVLRDFAREALVGAQATLVSPLASLTYSGMVPGRIAGHYGPEDGHIVLAPLAAAAKVDVVQRAAVSIDAAARRVLLDDGRVLDYDVLSVDVGGTVDGDTIPGAREHALFVRPMDAFVARLDGLLSSQGIAVIGGGAGGVELAMALQHRLAGRARVSLLTGGGPPLSGYAAPVQRRAVRALRRVGVTLFEDACERIEADHVVLRRGARLACDATVVATGTVAPAWLKDTALALDEHGFIATQATLQSVSHPEVFAAGDVASRVDAPHPRSGVYAVRAGPPLAVNLRRFVAGGELVAYRPQRRSLNLLSCGDRYAIASWGGWSAEGRWAWWWKDRIDRGFIDRFTPKRR